MTDEKTELLAPAGSLQSMVAAFSAGADAVYMGGQRFGARAFAENPDDRGLLDAIDYAHLQGKKLFLTVNTLLKEHELCDELAAYLKAPVEEGLDAVIVQDLGVLRFLRTAFPKLRLHVSTQGTVCGAEGARRMKEMGAVRVILPRELSLAEIRAVKDGSGLETEVFVHGSLCYCYSGQCLMSSFLGGRSGNRGRCAQPCRLPYEGGYLLNLKDLCGLKTLPALLEAGVSSLKIEGRMKSPAYTAGVVSVYRRYLDRLEEKGPAGYRVDPGDLRFLSSLFDRGGFTEGYYRQHNGADMLLTGEKKAFITADDALLEKIAARYGTEKKPVPVQGRAELIPGKPIRLTVQAACGGRSFTAEAEGPAAETASGRPLTEEAVRRQLCRTGESSFVFDTLEIVCGDSTFVPVSRLNELRRSALDALEAAMLAGHRSKNLPDSMPVTAANAAGPVLTVGPENGRKDACEAAHAAAGRNAASGPLLTVSLEDPALLETVLAFPGVSRVILSADTVSPEELKAKAAAIRKAGKECYYAFPYVFRQEARTLFTEKESLLRDAAPDGWLLRSADALQFVREKALPGRRLTDAGVYAWNSEAVRALAEAGADAFTYPYEPHAEDLYALKDAVLPAEMIVYGRIPMMISAQCLRKTGGTCLKQQGKYSGEGVPAPVGLKDRTGQRMPVRTLCRFCYNIIYNAVPLWLADQKLPEAESLRVALTDETPAEAASLLDRFTRGLAGEKELLKPAEGTAFTRGHFRKGVQ